MAWWMAIPAIVKAGTSVYDYFQAREQQRKLGQAQKEYQAGLQQTIKEGISPEARRAFVRRTVGGVRREVLPEAQRLGAEERARQARALGPGASRSLALAAPTKAEMAGLAQVGRARAAAERSTRR